MAKSATTPVMPAASSARSVTVLEQMPAQNARPTPQMLDSINRTVWTLAWKLVVTEPTQTQQLSRARSATLSA